MADMDAIDLPPPPGTAAPSLLGAGAAAGGDPPDLAQAGVTSPKAAVPPREQLTIEISKTDKVTYTRNSRALAHHCPIY